MEYIIIIISAVFVNNILLSQFLGVCPFDAITISNNLAYIDFNKCKLCRKCVTECPTHAIWEVNFPIRLPKPVESINVEQ